MNEKISENVKEKCTNKKIEQMSEDEIKQWIKMNCMKIIKT